VREYYEARADEYDDWWLGKGSFAERLRPGWFEEVLELAGVLSALPAARTLDVACGTGFLTRFLHGEVVGVDQSAARLRLAGRRAPNAKLIKGDAFELPFAAASFKRAVAGHFYGHLEEVERARFLSEVRRVAREWVIVDAALREDVEAAAWQNRILDDGSRWRVYRYFAPAVLAAEVGDGEVLFAGRWLVVVRSRF
jgi:demethylmenaquinone methyltransferase/2-methoxy-6-polyprenyl-1,4-benzoquinol methylase